MDHSRAATSYILGPRHWSNRTTCVLSNVGGPRAAAADDCILLLLGQEWGGDRDRNNRNHTAKVSPKKVIGDSGGRREIEQGMYDTTCTFDPGARERKQSNDLTRDLEP